MDINGNDIRIEFGYGVFGRCEKRYYKGILVVVKVFNNLFFIWDVRYEVVVMVKCFYLLLLYIFGVNVI